MLLRLLLALWCASALAAEHHGQVTFGGLPLAGATITASQGDKKLVTVSDLEGNYSFPDLADGAWQFRVEMQCFAPVEQQVNIAAGTPPGAWDLKLLPPDQMHAEVNTAAPAARVAIAEPTKKGAAPIAPANTSGGFQRTEVKASAAAGNAPSTNATPAPAQTAPSDESAAEMNQRAADGFLINGSSNNSATSPFGLSGAFGNNRRGPRSMYNGNLGLTFDNSVLDARSFSLTGQDTPKPTYDRLTGLFSFGGPIRIPHLVRNGPMFIINYQWTRNRDGTTQSGLVPTLLQRAGDLSDRTAPILDPSTGVPFSGNVIPSDRISSQARSLLNLYPLPNFTGSGIYNFQIPIINITHQDALQARVNKSIGRKDQIFGTFAYQNTRADKPSLFGFLDTTDTTGINSNINWRHAFNVRLYGTLGFSYSRFANRATPFFDNRENVSAAAGISGNNQEPVNWGPPQLNFSSGISPLTDSEASFTRNQTAAISYAVLWNRGRHNFSFGGDYKRQQFNLLAQQDPRGTFTFTGAATGSDLAGFLLGVPDTSSIAFGNADKYFRASASDAYANDDWRINPGFTLNAGLRWEYGSPITELYGRLVNLDVLPGFTAVAPVVANDPRGSLTGQTYPDSLVHPDKAAIEPRVAVSWRPFLASSMVVRAGYGLYYNTSVYNNIALQMAQQAPLSKSLSVQNSPANPLTLAHGFNIPPGLVSNTFAIDPNFRVGYTHNWQVSVQRDLPGALVMTATYLGIKGTRGMQEFLPNTYPASALNPCPSCPSGFYYLTSNGNSTREAGQLQLRRRLHNGFTASLNYTYAKAIDDAGLGGRGQGSAVIAQNWLNLSAERALSSFDQRHLLTLQAQYSTGMGIGGGTLLNGWRGALFKEWTFVTQISAGSGLPLTPIYLSAVRGTGVTGPLRPDYTGAPLYAAPAGLFLNPAAYVAPPSDQWGNAGRDSITGPSQFSLSASMGRTFRVNDRFSLDLRFDATNALNHVTYLSWITTLGSNQFGAPTAANAMRSIQTTLRARF